MTNRRRARLALVALVLAGFAAMATSPAPPRVVVGSANDDPGLSEAMPRVVRLVTLRLVPAGGPPTVRAEIRFNVSNAPVEVSIVRKSDGAVVPVEPIAVPAGESPINGVSFRPFASLTAGGSYAEAFVVTLTDGRIGDPHGGAAYTILLIASYSDTAPHDAVAEVTISSADGSP